MKTSTKIMMCIAGLLIIALGTFCLLNPDLTNFSLVWLLGLFLIVSGISTFFAWCRARLLLPQSGGFLLSSFVQIILGILVLVGSPFVVIALPYIFALWLLFEGLSVAIHSFDFKKARFRHWWILLILGIVVTVLGICALCQPAITSMTLGSLIGIGIILNGISYITAIAGINRFEKRLEKELA